MGPLEIPRVETQCHFTIIFTTQFHKLHIMRDSKTPVKQPLSLGGANPSPPLKTWPILWFVNVFERKPRQKKIKAILITKTGIHHFWWKTIFKPNSNFKQNLHDAIFDGNVYFNKDTSCFIRNITAFKVARQRAWFLLPGAVTEKYSMKISTSYFEKHERWKFIILAKSFKNTCGEIKWF